MGAWWPPRSSKPLKPVNPGLVGSIPSLSAPFLKGFVFSDSLVFGSNNRYRSVTLLLSEWLVKAQNHHPQGEHF